MPFIHRKTIIRTVNEKELEDDDDINVTGRWLPKVGKWNKNQYSTIEKPPPPTPPKAIFTEQPENNEYSPPIIEDQLSPEVPMEEPNEEPKDIGPKQGPLRKGIYVKINGLRNFLEVNNTKIRVALVDLTTLLNDEREQPCTFETEMYALPEVENPELKNYIENMNKNQSLDISLGKQNVTDKSKSFEVNFLEMNEETIFIIDIYYYCLLKNAWDNIYLIFQILVEKKEEADQNLHVVDRPMEETKVEKEFQGFTWLAFKCFTDKVLNVGRHLEHNFAPPMEKPPYEQDFNKTDDVTDFIIQDYMYDVNQLDDLYEKLKQKKEQKKKRNMKTK